MDDVAESGDVRSPAACIARQMRACGWESGRPFSRLFLADKEVCEPAYIVGEKLDDGDWKGVVGLDQAVDTAAVSLVVIDLREMPAYSAIDGDE